MLSDRERLEKAIDAVVGMILFDSSGKVIGSNEVFRQVTGYSSEEIMSGKLHWRTFTPPEWVAESERQMEKFALTGCIGPYEKEYLLKDGSRRWMMFTGRKLDEDTIVEFCTDISERKRAELAAQRSEQQRKEVIADLAHALNNPLQVATYALHVLHDDIALNPAAKALEDALQRIRDLTCELRHLSTTCDTGIESDAPAENRTRKRSKC